MEQTKIPETEVVPPKNKPLWQYRAGGCRASVWENERTFNGKTVTVRDVTFSKRYLDEDGEYKNTTKYNANDIPKAIHVLQKAYEHLITGEDTSNGTGQ